MRDISAKSTTLRIATAAARLKASSKTITAIRQKRVPKGDPFPVAKIAAVQAAKNTSMMIPYCHPLPVDFVDCRFSMRAGIIEITTEVKATARTGVEMEALAAAAAAALTLYDMLKMIDDSMEIAGVRLLEKKGGKSDFRPPKRNFRSAAILVVSDSVSRKRSRDESGRLIANVLRKEGFRIKARRTVPDDPAAISRALRQFADGEKADLVITTGGTGLGPRDHTPEATARVLEREANGIPDALRMYGQSRTPFSMLSRGRAGIRGKTLIVNLPGSPGGVRDSLAAFIPAVHHAFAMIEGKRHRKKNL